MKTLRCVWMAVLVSCVVACSGWIPANADDFQVTAHRKDGTTRWRIGYYEGGEYADYQKNLFGLIGGLMETGWLEHVEIPEQDGEQTKDLWLWLGENAPSDFIEFVPDAHYSADWDDATRETMAADIITRFNEQQDIDLMIAMGTWAGTDLANDQHHVPTIVTGTANPLKSQIITSIEDSGRDHIHARIDPNRYDRQVRIFYDIIGFQRLGVFYEDTVAGKSYAAIEIIEAVAEDAGFEIVRCLAESDVAVEKAEEGAKRCFEELGQAQVDAIYVPVHGGVTPNSLPELISIANSYYIPTFAQVGSDQVRTGFLMSISLAGYKYVGNFYAETIAKVLNGAKPRQLGQIFEDPPKIAINLKTAEIIGYDPPVDVLGAADEIFQDFE